MQDVPLVARPLRRCQRINMPFVYISQSLPVTSMALFQMKQSGDRYAVYKGLHETSKALSRLGKAGSRSLTSKKRLRP